MNQLSKDRPPEGSRSS